MSNPFASVDVDALETVTGGTTKTTSSSSSGSSANDQLLTTLQGIQSSITDLAKPQNSSTNTMMFMMMALAFSRPQNVVYVGRRGWW